MSRWQWALDRLYGLANWETRPPGTPFTFELARIERVLAALGHPQRAWPAVHVGGTNGKGSTCAMTERVLREAGLRVGLFTSPHVHTVRERIQVDGQPISRGAVIDWLEQHAALLDGEPELTTFEALTALACHHFAREAVDIAVIEVGLGGRLDTTRVVRPLVSVLTPIGLDHRAILGDTLRQIASDKVGIFRPGVPVVSARQEPEAAQVIEAEAARMGCPLARVEDWLTVDARGAEPTAQELSLRWRRPPQASWPAAWTQRLGLQGEFQRRNAATALLALATLSRGDLPIPFEAVRRGLEVARWPARFEVFPVAERGAHLVVDGAHNPHAARALVAALDEAFGEARRHLVLGVGLGKDLDAMLDVLLPGSSSVTTTHADHPKARPATAVAEHARRRSGSLEVALPIVEGGHPGRALRLALRRAREGEVVVATGSIFVAGDTREAWARLGRMPMPPRDPPTPGGEGE